MLFFEKAVLVALSTNVETIAIAQGCSLGLSHTLSYIVGHSMLHDYYRRKFNQKGREQDVLQYYTACGIALLCLPHVYGTVCAHFELHSTNPLFSPCLWSFISMFLFNFLNFKKILVLTIVLMSIGSVSMLSVDHTPSPPSKSIHQLYFTFLKIFEQEILFNIILLLIASVFLLALGVELGILLMGNPESNSGKKNKLKKSIRAKKFPPLYPNGWYKLAHSDEVPVGESKHVRACGHDFAIFRGENGKIAILDAMCPHLGANIAVGGKVKDNCIECPFHGWKFNQEGECKGVPYLEGKSEIPKFAKTKAWPSKEYANMICVFFHAEGDEPDYIPVELPEIDSGRMYSLGTWNKVIKMHIQDFAENAADYAHFNYVHDDLGLPLFLNSMFYIKHKVLWHSGQPDDPSESRFSYFTDEVQVCFKFLNWVLPNFVHPIVLFNGPGGIVYFRFRTRLGDVLLIKTFTPLDTLEIYVEDYYYADRMLPYLLVKFICGQALHAFKDDISIWENKSYSFNPMVLKDDGPMHKVRRWYSQFYTESSIRVPESLDW